MRTENSEFGKKGLRFYLRLVSILLFLSIVGVLSVLAAHRSKPVQFDGPKAGDFCLQDPRDQGMVDLSELLEKKKPSYSSSSAPNACSTINSFQS